MKHFIILFVISLGLTIGLRAQEIRLNGYADYVFKNRVDSYFSNNAFFDGQIQDGFRWGAGLEVVIPYRGGIELQYQRQETNAPTTYRDGFGGDLEFADFDLTINWVMLNFTRYFDVSDVFEPYAGIGAGIGIFDVTNPTDGNNNTETKFSWQVRAGSNIWLSDRLGLKAEDSLVSAVQAFGGGLYFGTGGAGAGLNSYSTMFQFGLGGGLVIRVKE